MHAQVNNVGCVPRTTPSIGAWACSPGCSKIRCTRSAARTHVKCVREDSASPYTNHGFTLVEVLVALAVIAIALTAVMQNFGQGVDTTIALRERTIAMWVAQNRLTHHYLANDWPSADTHEGTAEMAGREWRWLERVSTTPDADIRRIEIEIRAAPGREAAARLIGFLPKPATP